MGLAGILILNKEHAAGKTEKTDDGPVCRLPDNGTALLKMFQNRERKR